MGSEMCIRDSPFPLPDAVTILEPKDEEPVLAPKSENRNQPAEVAAPQPEAQPEAFQAQQAPVF